METSQMIIIALAVLVVIALVFFWPFGKSSSTKPNTYVPPTGANVSAPQAPATVSFYDVNVEYVYSGPPSKNGVSCYYNSYTYVDSQSATLNGTQPFNLQFTVSSGACPMTITAVNVSTGGFAITNVIPTLPFTLPANSNAAFQFNMRAPGVSFYGPLTVAIYYR